RHRSLRSLMSLLDIHLEDLRKSALSDSVIEMMQCRSVPGAQCGAISPALAGCDSVLVIPYLLNNGFYRVKTFPPVQTVSGTMRYWQAPGSQPHIYVLPSIVGKLNDPSTPLWIVEGEKKSASLIQRGYIAVAVSGLWCWKETDSWEGVDELKRI